VDQAHHVQVRSNGAWTARTCCHSRTFTFQTLKEQAQAPSCPGQLPAQELRAACCSAGLGQIDHNHLEKLPPALGMLVVKIGGPAYRIGMGGGAASSVPSGGREGTNAANLDFNAVQVLSIR
jgi:phosphoribosylformylglycinamidine (FGAM) synthase-like enzyme